MRQTRSAIQLLILIALAAGAPGCRATGDPAASPTDTHLSSSQLPVADPCAERLHEVCGSLLLYYHLYKRLPEKLADLSAMDAIDKPIPLLCPASGKPYVYDRRGLELRGKPGRIIIYDPEPSHSDSRWAVNVQVSGGSLIADVIDVPEQRFLQRLNEAVSKE